MTTVTSAPFAASAAAACATYVSMPPRNGAKRGTTSPTRRAEPVIRPPATLFFTVRSAGIRPSRLQPASIRSSSAAYRSALRVPGVRVCVRCADQRQRRTDPLGEGDGVTGRLLDDGARRGPTGCVRPPQRGRRSRSAPHAVTGVNAFADRLHQVAAESGAMVAQYSAQHSDAIPN